MSKCHAVARSFINRKGILEDCFTWFLTVMDNHKINISKIKLFKRKLIEQSPPVAFQFY